MLLLIAVLVIGVGGAGYMLLTRETPQVSTTADLLEGMPTAITMPTAPSADTTLDESGQVFADPSYPSPTASTGFINRVGQLLSGGTDQPQTEFDSAQVTTLQPAAVSTQSACPNGAFNAQGQCVVGAMDGYSQSTDAGGSAGNNAGQNLTSASSGGNYRACLGTPVNPALLVNQFTIGSGEWLKRGRERAGNVCEGRDIYTVSATGVNGKCVGFPLVNQNIVQVGDVYGCTSTPAQINPLTGICMGAPVDVSTLFQFTIGQGQYIRTAGGNNCEGKNFYTVSSSGINADCIGFPPVNPDLVYVGDVYACK